MAGLRYPYDERTKIAADWQCEMLRLKDFHDPEEKVVSHRACSLGSVVDFSQKC